MAIEIIKRGKLPSERKFLGDCYNCKTEVSFLGSDATFISEQGAGDYYSIPCPFCGNAINVDSSLGA